jgi:flagellar motor switch protein FliN/FliY
MNPTDIDAIVASAQQAKRQAAPAPSAPSTPAAAQPAPAAPRQSPAGLAEPDFAELAGSLMAGGEVPLAMLMDLTFPVSIELGRTSMMVQEILRLGRGSVIQLDRLAGEPIDVYIGDRLFAQGEVVVLGEHFGVRITRILQKGVPAETPA